MNIPRWYAIYTHPRAEKTVAEQLRLLEVENLLPLYRKLSRWKNGMKMKVELPLFPGYVFARIAFRDRLSVLRVANVARIVTAGKHPAALADREIAVLRAQASLSAAEPHPFMSIGDRVKVTSGPLAGLEGFLVEKKNDSRFVLCMDLIMQAMSVEIDPCDIERVSESRSNHGACS